MMRKKRLILSILALLIIDSRCSFTQVTAPVRENFLVVEDNNVTISAESSKTEFSGGEDIILNITIKNTGHGSLTIDMKEVERFFDIEVTGPDSQRAPLLAARFSRRMTSSEEFKLFQNQSKVATIWLNRVFDMTDMGPYKIKVCKKFKLVKGNKTSFIITAKTVVINVTSLLPTSGWH